jgi:hypothetical protein
VKESREKPMEIAPERDGGRGEWLGFAVLLIVVGLAIAALLLWLTGSFLMAAGTTVAMIALMLFMGAMASGGFDRRF